MVPQRFVRGAQQSGYDEIRDCLVGNQRGLLDLVLSPLGQPHI